MLTQVEALDRWEALAYYRFLTRRLARARATSLRNLDKSVVCSNIRKILDLVGEFETTIPLKGKLNTVDISSTAKMTSAGQCPLIPLVNRHRYGSHPIFTHLHSFRALSVLTVQSSFTRRLREHGSCEDHLSRTRS